MEISTVASHASLKRSDSIARIRAYPHDSVLIQVMIVKLAVHVKPRVEITSNSLTSCLLTTTGPSIIRTKSL